MPENFYHNDWPYADGTPAVPSGIMQGDASLVGYDELDFPLAPGVINMVKSTLDSDWDLNLAM